MSTLTQSSITLFIKEWEKQMEKIKNELRNMDLFRTIYSIPSSNVLTVSLKSPNKLSNALEKIKKIPNLSLYYTNPNYLLEVSDAIEKPDYFKANTLCVTLYESYGKEILVSQFKGNPSLAQDITNKLSVSYIIDLLHNGVIDKGVRSQMLSVNDTWNDFAHRYFSSQISPELENRLKDNTPKIMKTLETLKGIHDKLRKE